MKLKYISILPIAVLASYVLPAAAQNQGTKTTTKADTAATQTPPSEQSGLNEEIVVTSSYRPVLADAVKIRRNPDLNDKQPFKQAQVYSVIDKKLEDNSEIKQLQAMKMPQERPELLENNYVKGGIGSQSTTFAELYLNNGRDEALQLGGFFKHYAQNGSLPRQHASKQELGVFGRSIGEEFTLTGRINYTRKGNGFYGYDVLNMPDTLFAGKQRFNTLEGEAEIAKNYQDVENDFVYGAKLNAYTFGNAFSAKESDIVLTGYINKTVKQFYAGLGASLDFSTVKDKLYALNNNIARANPYLKLQGNNYKIDAGINLVSEFGFSNRLFIFPAAKAELQVIPKYVRIFAELKGDVNKSTLRNFAENNPFIGENIEIQNSVEKLSISAGLKGTAAPGLGFKATFFRKDIKDLPMYVNTFDFSQGNNRFGVIYDNGTSQVTGFNGELDFKASDEVDLFGRMEFRSYKLAFEEEAWNLPSFKLTAGTTIRINDKVIINGSLLFRGETKDRIIEANGENRIVNLEGFPDLNGGLEYRLTKKISIFGQVNNLLNKQYQTYLYYPSYGFNIFAGVGFGF
jgi:hypothetical protein